MKTHELCFVLICFLAISPQLPLFVRIPIDTLLGLYVTVWHCTWGMARFGEWGVLVGVGFFALFVWSRLVAYGVI